MTTPGRATLEERFPLRAASWQLRTRRLEFGRVPLVMGIVNCTPDSFSDGGKFFDSTAAVDRARRLIDEGADIVDIGGESTRPYSTPVDADEELRRVMPVVETLCCKATPDTGPTQGGAGSARVARQVGTGSDRIARQGATGSNRIARLGATGSASGPIISIDTSKARVAREAIAAGCEIINDITALSGDPEMIAVAAESQCGVCAMHMQGTPQTMQDDPRYGDVVGEILAYLAKRRDALDAVGIDRERICLDPGIGFGKTHQHNLTLAANCWRFHELGCPVLAGHSRKGFIGKVFGDKAADRTFGTLGVSMSLAAQGIQVLRVHDVAATRQALALFAATGGIDGQENRL
jgi:dihydropteroate synthase